MIPKFCKDCKHFRQTILDKVAVCRHPKSLLEYDLVLGDPIYTTCQAMRTLECGKEAKFYNT